MKATMLVIGALALSMLHPTSAAAKDKKKPPRGMIESMQSLPCGMKQKGLNGLGAVWGSVGVTSVSSNEKLCPQYLFRTDDLEYHIRPKDTKHPVILPIGHEAEFRVNKDEILLKVTDGDHKTRAYHVISMEPINTANAEQDSNYGRSGGAVPAANQAPASSSANQPVPAPAVQPQNNLPQRAVNQSTPPPPASQVAPPQY
ncbi:MAG: hypothetical protein WBV46_15530 [Terriglobales bacterium]|jgi:hypothetical protein